MVMCHLDKTPNQACRENDTAQQFTNILLNVPLSTWELRNRPPEKVGCHHHLSSSSFFFLLLSHTKRLTSIAYKLKQ